MTAETKSTEDVTIVDRINHFKSLRHKWFLSSLRLELHEINTNTSDVFPESKTVSLKVSGEPDNILKIRVYTKQPDENLVEVIVYEPFNKLPKITQQASLGIAASYCNPAQNPTVVPFSEVFSNEKIQISDFFSQLYQHGSETYEGAWKIAKNFRDALDSHKYSESH